MPTQKGGYFVADGTRVPSVTTILGRFKSSEALIKWAWEQGRDGKDYRETRDAAAAAGTMAHAAVEAHIRGKPFEFEGDIETVANAKRSFGAFLEWLEQMRLRVTHTEMPLVSEKYRFGGTFDAIIVGNQRAMCDWKCSNGVYGEYLCQVAAYGLLWEENFPDEPIAGGYHLVRFDRKYADFTHHWWVELDAAREAFLLMRRLYELDHELRARAK